MIAAVGDASNHASVAQRILAAASGIAEALATSSPWDRQTLLQRLITRLALHEDSIEISMTTSALCNETEADQPSSAITLTAPIARVRRGHQIRLVIQASDAVQHEPKPRNERLVMLLAQALTAREMVVAAPEPSIEQIAIRTGTCRKRLTKLVKLSWLAPDLMRRVLDGREPMGLHPRPAGRQFSGPAPLNANSSVTGRLGGARRSPEQTPLSLMIAVIREFTGKIRKSGVLNAF